VEEKNTRRSLPFDGVALVLQGGGALGAYQAGVFQAIYEANIEVSWVCGTSIGAVNGAFEFSRSTMAARWRQGLSDVLIALRASPWLAPMPKELGVRVFDVMHDILTGRSEPV